MRPLDIGVAGCGPGGLAAALLLARDGHRVCIYERFEAPRPLGSGLMIQPTGLAVLERLGLGGSLRATAAPIERLFGQAKPSGRTVLDVRYEWLRRPGARGWGVHRAALFDLLHRAARAAGIPIETGRTVSGCEAQPDGRLRLRFGAEASPPHDLVVDALGASSALVDERPARPLAYGALWASLERSEGFDDAALEQRYRRASTMAGVLPIGRAPGSDAPQAAFFWLLQGDALDAWREAGLDPWKAEVRALWPEMEAPIRRCPRLRWWQPPRRPLPRRRRAGLRRRGSPRP